MTLAETLRALEAAGTEQTRKTYRRHGAGDNLYGVSFAVLGALAKKIKRDQRLARELWKTGNVDAQQLALMIADPGAFTSKEIDEWVAVVDWHGVADGVAKLVHQTAHAAAKREAWMKSKSDFKGQCGYLLLALAAMGEEGLPDSYFEQQLVVIEKGIAQARNWTRYAMNGALIAIGIRNDRLKKLALAAAGRIGKVEVDHGDTGCKTPDAAAYIEKATARRKAK